MDPATGAIIGAGINAGSNVLGNILNWFSGQSANSENRELMREQNQWSLQMWQRNNEYNSPQAQMARLRAAGINPALAYSNGMDNTSSAVAETADAPTMKPFQAVPFQVDPSVFGQAEVQKAQADLFRAQAADLLGETPEAKARIFEYGKRAAKMEQEITESEQRIAESAAKIKLMDEQAKHEEAKRLNIRFEQSMKSQEWVVMKKKLQAEIRKIDKETQLTDRQLKEMVETFVYRKTGLKLSNDLTQAQIDNAERMFEKLGVDMNKAIAETDLMNQQYNMNKPAENTMNDGVGNPLFEAIVLFFKLCSGLIHG